MIVNVIFISIVFLKDSDLVFVLDCDYDFVFKLI
jgi:hypothetical protein